MSEGYRVWAKFVPNVSKIDGKSGRYRVVWSSCFMWGDSGILCIDTEEYGKVLVFTTNRRHKKGAFVNPKKEVLQ